MREDGLPLVVIVGRPNTGKSTLFNRLLHKRRAITDPTPGVTRDPIRERAMLGDEAVFLMDTGGFKLTRSGKADEDALDEVVTAKTLASLDAADVIVLLLAAGEIASEDEQFIELLRPYSDKLIVAVNKTEGGRLVAEAWEVARYGFSEPLFISAEHGDNIGDLRQAIVSRLAHTAEDASDQLIAGEDSGDKEEGAEAALTEADTTAQAGSTAVKQERPPIRLAIVGKPNTGKSTLSNLLTSSDASIVSDIAGTTRDVVEGSFVYKSRQFCVLDTAGIRRKARVSENIEYYSVNRAIKSLDRADVVLYLIDAAEGLSEQDKKVVALAYERGRAVIFVLNKWDTQQQDRATLKKAVRNIEVMFGQMSFAPVLAISARDGTGIAELLNTAMRLYAQLERKIDTPALNAALQRFLAASPPASANRFSRVHFRYIVQTGVNPVRFLLFASRPELVPKTYLAYLKNCIRRELGFESIPVVIEVKASRQRWEKRKGAQ